MPNIQLFDPNQKPIEQCIREAYESFNVAPLGGASGDGWSKINDFQRCPYRYWLLHEPHGDVEASARGNVPAALEIGSLFHTMLACHYIRSIAACVAYPVPYALARRVEALGGSSVIVEECNRLYGAYFNHYNVPSDEGIQPLAVELTAGLANTHTCRYDMLATYGNATWIVEHKTASRETRDVLESWWLDGEIIGEVYGYKLSGLDKVFGPLAGVLVNIVIKTQVPKFRRVEVVVTDSIIEQYARDRAYWSTLRQSMREAGYWPRKLNGCIGRYDTCTFWDHCRDASVTDDARLHRLLKMSLER